jgi:hypothetical protein
VPGGKVLEKTSDEQVHADIRVKLGALAVEYHARSISPRPTPMRIALYCGFGPARPEVLLMPTRT